MRLNGMARLAFLTRRWDRHRTPIRFRLSRRLLGLLCDRKEHKPVGQLVMPYDEGRLHIDLSTQMGYEIMFDGYHNAEMARVLKRLIAPGDTCLDVGANIGAYTVLMAFGAGRQGRVVAIEPNPVVAQRLRDNLIINGLDFTEVIEVALAEADGEVTFYTWDEDARNIQASSLKPMSIAHAETTVRAVCGPTLGEVLELERCDVIKIDVTGAELLALKQLRGVIAEHLPCIFVEYCKILWDRFEDRVEEAIGLVRDLGYRVYVIKRNLTYPLEGPAPDRCNLFCLPPSHSAEPLA